MQKKEGEILLMWQVVEQSRGKQKHKCQAKISMVPSKKGKFCTCRGKNGKDTHVSGKWENKAGKMLSQKLSMFPGKKQTLFMQRKEGEIIVLVASREQSEKMTKQHLC